MKTICLYHSVDLDGWMSAAIVKHWFLENLSETDSFILDGMRTDKGYELCIPKIIDFVGYTYGDKVPDVSQYDRIIMCDMSLLKGVMEQLHEDHTKEIIWIDHHLSAIRDSETPLKYNDLKGIRDTKFAACELTWMYFFGNPIDKFGEVEEQNPMPEIVRLLGRYDCFGHKGTAEEKKVLEFQYGARNAINNYETAYDFLKYNLEDDSSYTKLDTHIINCLHVHGASIYEYLCQDSKQVYNTRVDIKLDNLETQESYKFALINKERFNPINFGIDYHKDGYDGIACFWLSPKGWHFSLYNDNGLVDCSQIAKSFGGGGHKGAAGFILGKDSSIDSFIIPRRL